MSPASKAEAEPANPKEKHMNPELLKKLGLAAEATEDEKKAAEADKKEDEKKAPEKVKPTPSTPT